EVPLAHLRFSLPLHEARLEEPRPAGSCQILHRLPTACAATPAPGEGHSRGIEPRRRCPFPGPSAPQPPVRAGLLPPSGTAVQEPKKHVVCQSTLQHATGSTGINNLCIYLYLQPY